MESPFQLRQAFGADGIGFQEYDKDGNVTRCTRYSSFTPWRNSDLTNLDLLRDNQWSREEKSLGPRTAIRPSVNDSNSYTLIYDADKIGVLCFYDKLYVAFLSQYVANSTGKFDYIDTYYDMLFVPREVSRMDYLQHLIGRVQCNPKPCLKQTFKEWPCIGNECHFGDSQPGDENSAQEVVWYVNRKGTEIKLKKKDMLNDEPLPKPCFNVCQDKVCPPPEVLCKSYIDDLAKCTQQLKDATAEIIKLKGQLKGCQTQLAAANDKITQLQLPVNKRNIIAYSNVNYQLKLLDNSNWIFNAWNFPGYEETWSRLTDALKGGETLWIKEDEVGFGTFQGLYSKIANSMEATNNVTCKRFGYMFATYIKLSCIFTMLGTSDWQDITDADINKFKVWYNDFISKDIWIMAFKSLNNNDIGEVKYIKPKYMADLHFSPQAKADKKSADSGLGSTEETQEESQEDPVSGVDSDDIFRRPRDPPTPQRDTPVSSDKENEPDRMEDEDENCTPTQR